MGIYLNPGNGGFRAALNSRIYVDKSGLIEYTNSRVDSKQKYICVSRPRRFGKTMAAELLIAYYAKGGNAEDLFRSLDAAALPSFKEHANKHDVIFLNIQNFMSETDSVPEMIKYLQRRVMKDLRKSYGRYIDENETILSNALSDIYEETQSGFIFILDEWDCIFRERSHDDSGQREYLDFLRNLFKDRIYVSLVYMTGILPIKKYGTHSALNMFEEISMTDSKGFGKYMGFTEDEVKILCDKYSMDFSEVERWYDGYTLPEAGHIYNPKSVIDAMLYKEFKSYWVNTETYEALKIYIDMNFDGLKDAVISMLGGGGCHIDISSFTNDMTTFRSKDDVLTLLVHLGYLSYDSISGTAYIPNEEIRGEFITSIKVSQWKEVINAVSHSESLLNAVLSGDEKAAADGVNEVHMETTSILTYNNENSLSCTISLAFFSARNYYRLIREMPAGKGFADIVFLPRTGVDKPAIIVELKWCDSPETAIAQIKEKKYIKALDGYSGGVVLAGISYDRNTKEHLCKIERITI